MSVRCVVLIELADLVVVVLSATLVLERLQTQFHVNRSETDFVYDAETENGLFIHQRNAVRGSDAISVLLELTLNRDMPSSFLVY